MRGHFLHLYAWWLNFLQTQQNQAHEYFIKHFQCEVLTLDYDLYAFEKGISCVHNLCRFYW